MNRLAELQALIASDGARMDVLRRVQALDLPDCWAAAGFVRNGVWDHLHRRPPALPAGDVDVIWFDAAAPCPDRDAALEATLRLHDPHIAWSVKNQARMHARNGDQPYRSAIDAMRHWPETATAVGVRLGQGGSIEVAAPFGLEDLFALVVRPTPRFAADKHPLYAARLRAKQWHVHWPGLHFLDTARP